MESDTNKKILFISIFFIIFFPGIRDFFRFLPTPIALLSYLVYVSFAAVTLFFLIREPHPHKIKGLLGLPWLTLAILFITLLVGYYFYPIADARKLIGLGSDQDDCIIIGASRLLELKHPYLQRTYLNNPCSPGPGILLLFSPFILIKSYIFGTVASLAYCAFVIADYTKKIQSSNIFLLITIGSIIVPELLVDGSDLIFIGCGIAAITVKTTSLIRLKNNYKLIILAVMCGLLSSSRINFLILSPVLSLLIYPHWKNGAILFLVISVITAVAPSTVLYMIDPINFTPLHLLSKGNALLPPFIILIIFFISTGSLIYGFILSKKNVHLIPIAMLLSIAPFLIALGLSDLAHRDFALSTWYGANYLAPLIPLASIVLALKVSKPTLDI